MLGLLINFAQANTEADLAFHRQSILWFPINSAHRGNVPTTSLVSFSL